jgi:biopolymer transport protein ExbB
MFLAADIVVKLVMIGLAFASVLTWTIWFAKAIEFAIVRRRLKRSIGVLGQARSLAECLAHLKPGSAALTMAREADKEWHLSADAIEPAGVKERVASRLTQLQVAAARRITRGTGMLATIGATAPFVGLFGTVWGIMNSFIGISKQQTTNLAVVAPGIAEALLATALGLVAAIPAVVLYNVFSRWVSGYRALYAEASNEVERLVSRDLDRAMHDLQSGNRHIRRNIAAE